MSLSCIERERELAAAALLVVVATLDNTTQRRAERAISTEGNFSLFMFRRY